MREIRLRDGAEIPVRPIAADDKELLARSFERLSFESRVRRFFTPIAELSRSQLAYLTEIDHSDHEALVAIEPATGDAIAVARYVRSTEEPVVAEAAVTVVDDWQGRGLGGTLLEALAERAREEDIRCFTAAVQGDNVRALRMLEGLGDSVRTYEGGHAEIRIDLVAPEDGRTLGDLLRAAAAGSLVVAGAVLHRTGATTVPGAHPRRPPGEGPIETIVAGTDGSQTAGEAAVVAVELARRLGCRLHLVSAYNEWAPGVVQRARDWVPAMVSPLSWLVAGPDDAAGLLEAAGETARSAGVEANLHPFAGEPAGALISVAEEQGADLIVVGSKGMTGAARFLLGSVAAKVTHHAPCSVLIVRTGPGLS